MESQNEIYRDRVKQLLASHWAGNQRQMARDIGFSQAAISNIVNGLRRAGKRFLAALSKQGAVNADWLWRGEGEPLVPPEGGSLPISLGLLAGVPSDYPNLLTGRTHPIALSMFRTSRYWLELQTGNPLLHRDELRLAVGDLLLMETAVEWVRRPEYIAGRICGVRHQDDGLEPTYVLSILNLDSAGMIFDALDLRDSFRFKGKPQILDLEGENKGRPRFPAPLRQSRIVAMTDVIAACVYLARPSPGA